jgi:hypothetical protein
MGATVTRRGGRSRRLCVLGSLCVQGVVVSFRQLFREFRVAVSS